MNERVWQLLLDSFWQILLPGIRVTIPLTLVSFSLGLVIALLTAMVQVANIPVLKQMARIYVWIIRGTPLLVQLFDILRAAQRGDRTGRYLRGNHRIFL